MPDLQLIVHKKSNLLTREEKLQRFFTFILDFKLGQERSYRSKEWNSSKLRQHNHSTQEDESCTSESSIPNIILSSQSLRLSSSVNKSQRKQQNKVQNVSEGVNLVHYGYCCDKCYINPIRGQRYNCKLCDYDLCQACYKEGCKFADEVQQFDCEMNTLPHTHQYHEHPLTKIQPRTNLSSSVKGLLFSGRRQKASILKHHKSLLCSEKLHKSTK